MTRGVTRMAQMKLLAVQAIKCYTILILVTIAGQQQNLKVTSHILESDQAAPDMFLMYHCWQCGQKLMQFSGYEIMEMPGGSFSHLPIMILCRVCKRRHLFNSVL